ncbi:hypothetical protein LTS09_013189 [Friedmanniomyces endolithicus]|nr:hypothetical protein LTS09_013189 [Friedmanniomyces endolithicus]
MAMQCASYQQYQPPRKHYQPQPIQPRHSHLPTPDYSPEPIPRPQYYVCLYAQCATTGHFARHADLQRHVQVVHNPESLQRVACEFPGCHRRGQYGFSRKDKMVDHMREVHKAEIPKRSPGRRSP